ncbi:ROK family protein [Schnuerera ultunensis]|uniref:ROK family protein n=1 Tax=Schnuerera ultunensis TaxID=45497 RepID=UPI0003FA32DF|nr:ROK family protein [Schnuerera ultunensis]
MKKVIGIDLGGTSIYGGLINEKGEVLKKASQVTGSQGGRTVVINKIMEVIKELIEGGKVEAIGLGSPGFIDVKKGEVLTIGGNIKGWAGTKIREELSKEFRGIPIFVENDANVAAVCEEWLGAGKGLDSFIMLTLGTGVGGAIFSKKSGIWYGKNYQGAELGHTILYPNGRLCTCGQKGCVEQYISGNAVEKTYLELTGERLEGKDIFKNYETDKNCKKAIDKFVADLGTYLISIKNIFDPEGIIIGGGVINSKEFWWEKAIDYYYHNCNNPKGTEILPAKYLNDAGMIGAAKVAFDNI